MILIDKIKVVLIDYLAINDFNTNQLIAGFFLFI